MGKLADVFSRTPMLQNIIDDCIADGSLVADKDGNLWWYDRVEPLMDDGLWCAIQIEIEPQTNQEWLDAYAAAHECKYGVPFLS